MKKNDAFLCLFRCNKTLMSLGGLLYSLDNQAIREKYILKRFSVSAFQLFFEGCHFSSFYIFIYIIY